MEITEYFARLVTAGLAPDYKNICAIPDRQSVSGLYIQADKDYLSVPRYIEDIDSSVQLRKNGIDLYGLEWRKPTQQDIKNMCWFKSYENDSIIYSKLFTINIMCNMVNGYVAELDFDDAEFDYCLLADYGQIAPTVEDFERVYNGN